ncbi:RNA-guided endonuclease InsQ/TnpB family protein [Turicimonas muris]|uniref:RNA-guided endonuclease InsQ/TnpB family protein n=1 Tax=Turicimonas muris TaxID=1796652 RepID=UPI0025B3F101|nr:transposase [Turicimonas muris]
MPQRVERIIINRSHPNWTASARLCSLARKLGNCASYILRHRLFDKKAPYTRAELDRALREQYPQDYRAMPSAASAQRQGQIVAKQFKSFAKASAEYKKHPEKFLGKPKLPGYRNKYRTFCVGRNGYKIENHRLIITGGDTVGFNPIIVRSCSNQSFNAKATGSLAGDLRIIPKGNSFVVELTYQIKENERTVSLNRQEAVCIDLGVNNFAAIVSTKPGTRPILVKGGFLKMLNQSYNKRAAQLRSKGHLKHLASVSFKRQRRIDDALHKISRTIIDFCVQQEVGRIVIGKNKFWKQLSNMGRRNNQNFVNLPHSKLIEQLIYKGQEYGIEVSLVSESYTSKASALDFDDIPDYEKGVKKTFSGKRIKRGLYLTKQGVQINADTNSAINIGRNELGDEWLKKLLGLDEGVFVNTPTVFRTPYGERRSLEAGVRSGEAADFSLR